MPAPGRCAGTGRNRDATAGLRAAGDRRGTWSRQLSGSCWQVRCSGCCSALVVPILAKVGVERCGPAAPAAFADQLDDSLQLMASGLRAGHSMLQALNSVAAEAEEPTSPRSSPG